MDNQTSYKNTIQKLQRGIDLGREEARLLAEAVLEGSYTPIQIAALLTALSIKGETADELTEFAISMRQRAQLLTHHRPEAVDIVGTGGDHRNTFNISTAAAFVMAGAGVAVAKHGNRGISSRCGSADVLQCLGVQIDAPLDVLRSCLEESGIAFLFAPLFHPVMKALAPLRKELGIRTIFNLLGPLLNPAGVHRQVTGVFAPHLTPLFAQALNHLDCHHALVFSARDGLDEISLTAETQITELKDGAIHTSSFDPQNLGLSFCTLTELEGDGPQENAALLRQILELKINGARRDIVLLNAAAGIYVSGRASSLKDGLAQARESLESRQALAKLEDLKRISNGPPD